jgi:prophage regulatory protein
MDVRERFVSPKETTTIVNLSRTSIWRLERQGKFPQRYLISAGRCAYKLSELMQWMEEKTTVKAA